MRIYAPWEKKFKQVTTPLEHFVHSETASGIALIFATIIALIIANTALIDSYSHLMHTEIGFTVGSFEIKQTIHHWVNHGLMSFFFFVIGLEVKREVLAGELSNLKASILPISAAIGGMVFPAIIYVIYNSGAETISGWGVPMATDLAFAISILILLKNRISPTLITFLVAFAIVDDIGSVMVIAAFYTDTINFVALSYAGVAFAAMMLLNRFGIHYTLLYFIPGLLMWFFVLESGVHATVAGLLAALTIPIKPKLKPESFAPDADILLTEYKTHPIGADHLLDQGHQAVLTNLKCRIESIESPVQRLERSMHLPVGLLVIPIFALTNAAITIDLETLRDIIMSPVSMGIMFGLIMGKIIGIFGVSYIMVKSKLANLPKGVTMSQVFGVSLLGGIGFTMSIFIAELGLAGIPGALEQAKMGILFASFIAGLAGYLWLRFTR
jgi:NhaA family Na+:H+ antiporter